MENQVELSQAGGFRPEDIVAFPSAAVAWRWKAFALQGDKSWFYRPVLLKCT